MTINWIIHQSLLDRNLDDSARFSEVRQFRRWFLSGNPTNYPKRPFYFKRCL